MFSYGPLHMTEQKQDEPIYNSSVRIRSVALRTCQKRWTIGRGGERGSGISTLMARQDDEMMIHIYIVIHRQICFVLSELINVAIRLDSRSWDRNPVDSNANPRFYHQPRGNQRKRRKFEWLWITIVIVYIYPLYGDQELNSYEEPCIYANGNIITSFAKEGSIYIYIYIYCRPQTDLFRSIRTYLCGSTG